MEIFLFYYKFCSLKATDHTYYGLAGPTTFAGWCENSQKVCKSLASNWWFTKIFTCPPNLPWGLSWRQTHCNCGLFFNPLTPESDTHIISPDSFTPKSSIKVMRIRGDICKIKKTSVIGQILFVSTIGNVLQRSYKWRLGWKWLFFSKLWQCM